MDTEPMNCPKCGGIMSQGYVPGEGLVTSQTTVIHWFPGIPIRSFLGGIKLKWFADKTPSATFRCDQCGFLESYARNEFALK